MKSLSVMHQAKHVGAYERFLMGLAWELELERHHRLQRGLYPNMFTANYVVARYPCVKSILETKIPTLLMILGQRFPCCSALSSNLSSKPYKVAALRSSCYGVDFKTTSSAESV